MNHTMPIIRSLKEPYCETTLVTPETAKKWLAKNHPHNRTISKEWVALYAGEMLNNRWYYTGQAIIFDVNGHLVNGQHELQAIINSQYPQTFTVSYNVPEEALPIIDGERKLRSYVDMARLSGDDESSSKDAAVVRLLELGLTASQNPGRYRVSGQVLRGWIKKWYLGLNFMNQFGKRPGLTAAKRTAIIKAYYIYNNELDRLSEFINVFAVGNSRKPEDDAAANLSKFQLPKEDLLNTTLRRNAEYYYTELAIINFMKKKSMGMGKFRHTPEFETHKINLEKTMLVMREGPEGY